MKQKIRPYIQFLIRQNMVYFVTFIILMILTGLLVPYFLSQIRKTASRLTDTKREVFALETKQRILQTVVNENAQDIDQDLALITGLIPDSEDYFSMIYSLERLSQQTGFIITNYVVNLANSDTRRLSLTVTGQGDSAAFLELLRTYNFGGGRLITAEKIGISASALGGGISLDLNFYNEKPTINANEKLNFQASIDELNELREKVKFSLTEAPPDQPLQGDYPTKQTLF